jgi:SAM-dependent methyltransferase
VKPLTPTRRRGFEYLDEPGVDPAIRARSHRDIALANTLFGGTRALDTVLHRLAPRLPRAVTVLDVGGGPGNTLRRTIGLLRGHGVETTGMILDNSADVLRMAVERGLTGICGCARALPFADRSVDVTICSLLLHHFDGDDLISVLSELDRVTRERVIVADLQRSWTAAAGLWFASFPLAFHPISRHDGIASIFRGFTGAELRDLIERATGVRADVARFLGFRLLASWDPGGSRGLRPAGRPVGVGDVARPTAGP